MRAVPNHPLLVARVLGHHVRFVPRSVHWLTPDLDARGPDRIWVLGSALLSKDSGTPSANASGRRV